MPKERDPFRKYVDDLKNRKWKCKFCGAEFAGSTPRIRAHLAGIPGYGIKACERVEDPVRAEALETFDGKGSGLDKSTIGTLGKETERTVFGASQSVLPSDDASNPTDTQNSNRHGRALQQPSCNWLTGTGTASSCPQDQVSLPPSDMALDNLDNIQQSDPSNRRLDAAHGKENASSIQQLPMNSSASFCVDFSELQALLELPTHPESETEEQNARGLSSSPNDEVHCSSMSVREYLSLDEHIADGITLDSLLHPTNWSNLDHSLPENLPESREAIVNTFEEIQTNELHNPTVGSSLQIVSSLGVHGANRLLDCGQPCIDEVVPVRSSTSSTDAVQHPGQLPLTSDKEDENDIRQFPSRTPMVIDPSTALQHSSDSHIFEATIVHSLVPEASTNPIGPPSSHASVLPQRQSVPHQSINLETAHQNPTVPSSSWKNHLVACHPQALTDMDACMPSSQAPNNASPPPRILPCGTGLIGPSSILDLHMNESAPVTSHPNTDNFEENRALKRKSMENMEEKRQVATIGKYVGTDDQVGHIMGLMNIDAKDKRMVVVIHGEAGIGKTTLAKLIYNQMSWGFDGCSFIADITETAQELGGLQLLQTKLISDVLKRELEDVSFISGGIEFLRDLFCNMRVLIVLDDVENAFHVEKLIGDGFDCFASGSRILVTTRNNAVLEESPQIWAYHVSRLNKDQALQLLRQHASLPTSLEILNNALNAMAGLPLFIEVMGAVLNGTPQERRSQLLMEPMFRQQNVRLFLEKVFQTLDYKQKQIFLDIACFTTSIYSRIARYLWYDTSFLPSEILTPLAKIGENNQIWMHSLLRQFGREIVSMENLTDPGRRSRLFDHEIAFDTIKRKKGTEKVEALCLNFHGHTSDKLRPEDFKSMPNLRFLQLDDADIAGDFANLFPNLRWLRWRGCPRHLQPFNFQLGNLTILDLSWSKVTKDWEGWDQIEMKNLRVLDLTGCADLLVTPKFSGYKNLAILILERCTQLVKIDHSIDDLQHLVTLNLKFCTELSMLPVEVGHLTALKELYMDGTSIQEIPISIGHLKQLETLTASNCFSLTQLPRTICHLTNISLLSLDGTKIMALPDSIGELIRLKHLSLRDCRQLRKLPNSIGNIGRSLVELDVSGTGVSKFPDSLKNLQNLKVLRMDSCFFRKFPPGIGKLTSLKEIHASWCRSLEGEIPSEIKKLHNLRILRLRHSSISSIPMEIHQLSNLHTLDLLHCNMIKELPRLPSSIKVFYVDDELKSSHLLDSPLHSTDWSNLHRSLPENLLESRVVLVNTSEEIETNELHNPTVGSSLQIDSSFDVDGANGLWDCSQPREMEMVPVRSSTSLTDTGQHPSQLPPRFDEEDGNETCQFLSRTPTDVDPSIASQHTSDSDISEDTIIDSPVPKASTNTTGASSSHVTDSPMAIGEIVLGSFLEVLFDRLTSLGLEYAQRKGINTALLDKWKGMLETINVVLEDAEDKQLGGNRLVKLWLDDVRDLAYDMEDLLNEFAIEATQVKSGAESSASRDQNLNSWKFFSWGQDGSSGSNLNSCSFETKVREISGRLENIVTRKARLTLRENAADISNYTNKRLPSTSLPETRFFGREKEEAELLEILIGEVGNSDARLSIVPIVGMGGVGKTAMAQRLYNDPKMDSYFERKAWVCVSDVFDVLDITKTILQSITRSSCEGNDLNKLQVMLKDDLSGKKFLVVLDDVWNEKYGEWTSLLKPLEAGAKGSKIIITTRNHSVVSITGALPYSLKELSDDNCTDLLAYHALEARNFERHSHLEIVGKKIAEKCRGLPLVAKILGGLLRNKENLDEWEAILNNRIWDVESAKNDEVLLALKLSYVHLPSYLKRCFTYCAVFPKDYEFERDELVLLWIAVGFLDGRKAKENVLRSGREYKENVLRSGREYFDELVSRSFLQQSSVDTSKFVMHDLLNDLAKSIADVTCFTFEESQVVSDEDDASFEEKVRYASCVSRYVTSKSLRAYAAMKVLRSLMLLTIPSDHYIKTKFISGKVLHDLLVNLKYLRVLSLCHCDIIEVPNCVCDLKHLRYLNLSYTNIKRLPNSIGALCKLQALMLRGCRMLSMLPPGITKLVRLQFLDIRDTRSLEKMPLGISKLKNLIILSKFVVGPERGSQLNELKNLPHLQGDLLISELQEVEKVRDAIDANLSGKQDLSNLFLHWNKGFGDSRNTEREAWVLHSLRPHTNIKNLTISYYGGELLPSWLGDPSYFKIVSLCLHGCPNVGSLPSLGHLPSLRELSLEGLNAIRMIGSEFYGTKSPFPSLTILKFEGLSAWKEWSHYAGGREEKVPFSCLQHLVVQRCPELTGTLPRQLDHLIKLKIHSCLHLNELTNEVHLPSLLELHIVDCNKEILKSLTNLTSLTILKIENLAELVCFDNGFMSYLVKLKELHISRCDKLTYLWQSGIEMQNLSCLQSVVIEQCPRFTSFIEGEGEIELPRDLERMVLSRCKSLERLPSKLHTLRHLSIGHCLKIMGLTIPPNDPSNNNTMSRLECLYINGCDSRISFPFAKDKLPTLKTLYIGGCKGVESLAEITAVDSLESLDISYCINLRSLPQCFRTLVHLTHLGIHNCPALEMEDLPPLPPTLSSLQLIKCPKIKSIADSNIDSYNNLARLEISDCPALEMEDFPHLPIPLSCLELYLCPKIKSLEWHCLTSLRELYIDSCKNIECFPEGGLPPNFREAMEPARKWGLPMLTSLETLVMDGSSMGGEGDKECFPSEEDDEDSWSLLFPSSLTYLHLRNMRNVEKLSSGLRNHLSSLQWLFIESCPKLRDLPEDGLPPSLQQLNISDCENLRDRCLKHTGDYWPLIQDIPIIYIGGCSIHEIDSSCSGQVF